MSSQSSSAATEPRGTPPSGASDRDGDSHPSTADAVIDLLLRGLIRRSEAGSRAVRSLAASMLECDPRLPELVGSGAMAGPGGAAGEQAGSSASTVSAVSTANDAVDVLVAQRRACEAFAMAWARFERTLGSGPELARLARMLSGSAARAMIRYGLRCEAPAARAPVALSRLVACGLVFGEDAAHAAASAGLFGRQPRVGRSFRAGPGDDALGSARLATWSAVEPLRALLGASRLSNAAAAMAALPGVVGPDGLGLGAEWVPRMGRRRVPSVSSGALETLAAGGAEGAAAASALRADPGLRSVQSTPGGGIDAVTAVASGRGRATERRRGSQASTSSVSAGEPGDDREGSQPPGLAAMPSAHRSGSEPRRSGPPADA